MNARLTPEAEQDVEEAIAWYDERGRDLGDQFLRCVHACIGHIESHPKMYGAIYRRVRRALVDVFPYQVLYEIGRNEIVIYGVYHCARDPRSWKRRLRG